MKFPELQYMVKHGIYSVRQLHETPHTVKNTIVHKECPTCGYVHSETTCLNCHLKNKSHSKV
ncbi:hypothetical protein [Dishui Lake phycodnavirus 4]|nr:hypothetical protein [Dishui Lake phycodnavirus 4]